MKANFNPAAFLAMACGIAGKRSSLRLQTALPSGVSPASITLGRLISLSGNVRFSREPGNAARFKSLAGRG